MNQSNLLWLGVIGIGVVLLALNSLFFNPGAGSAYVVGEELSFVDIGTADEPNWVSVDSAETLDHDLTAIGEDQRVSWTRWSNSTKRDYDAAIAADPNQTSIRFSLARTAGIWLAAIFTLSVFSFLIKDNPFYKTAEAIVVGVSAAYWMVVGFWDMLLPNLIGKLNPAFVTGWFQPDFPFESANLWYLVPLVLSIMLLMRLSPTGGWISRWPMAFIIGVFCGIRLVGFLQADFLSQIQATLVPVIAMKDEAFSLGDTIKNLVIVIGVMACLVYFFFSVEHTGAVGKVARVGIWFLMITFGVGFGFTVMGRIALLAIRLEFLFDDWLWIIDPNMRHTVSMLVGMVPFVPLL